MGKWLNEFDIMVLLSYFRIKDMEGERFLIR